MVRTIADGRGVEETHVQDRARGTGQAGRGFQKQAAVSIHGGRGGRVPALREAVRPPIGGGPLLPDGQRHQLADRGAHGRGHRPRRRGDRPRLHLHGHPRLGAGRRRDPGHRRHRREPGIESGRLAGCDRTANPRRDARAHVGAGLRHELDHGHRPGNRSPGDRGRLSGSGRRLRGTDARVDRPHRRVQLQPLQEHELRRGGRGRDRRRRVLPSASSARSIPAGSTGTAGRTVSPGTWPTARGRRRSRARS